MSDKFDVYVIDPDLDARMRLKQATTQVSSFHQVLQAGKLKECLDKLQIMASAIDVIFISSRFDREETQQFIQSAKQIQQS